MKNFFIIQNSIKTTFIFRESYIKELLKYGSVTVIAPNDHQESKERLEALGVIVNEISTQKIIYIIQMNFFILKARLSGGTIISHFLITFLFCYISMVPFNKKLVIYTEGLGSLFSNNRYMQKILKLFLVKNSARRFFSNNSERDLIGLDTDVVTRGIGINISNFNVKEIVVNDKYELLYVGRLIKDKGVNDAILSFRLLKEKRNDIILNLVGDIYPNNPSSLTQNDINLLKKEFGESIRFIGFTNDVKYWYHRSHLLVLPSKREGFPVCVMEASSIGLPTIGYDVVGVNDAIVPGVNGELVDYADIYKMTDAIDKTLDKDILLKYLETAPFYAKNNFCNKKKNKKIINTLSMLSEF